MDNETSESNLVNRGLIERHVSSSIEPMVIERKFGNVSPVRAKKRLVFMNIQLPQSLENVKDTI
jgi:hypothetical protein